MTHHSLVYLGARYGLYIGPTVAGKHRHHAGQLCVGLYRPFQLQVGETSAWLSHQAALVAPDVPHALDGGAEPVAVLLLEPESADYRQILRAGADWPGEEACRCPALPSSSIEALRRLLQIKPDVADVAAVCQRLIDTLSGEALMPAPLDKRVARVLRRIAGDPTRKTGIAALAAEVALSPDHLAHLFRRQVGVPVRRFRRWAAIRLAVRECLAGNSLTHAAHRAGFTDSAHLSHSFRAMFGFPPSLLLSGDRVHVLLDDESRQYQE